MTTSELKGLREGDTVTYRGMEVVDPATKKVLLSSPAGRAVVTLVGTFGVTVVLPDGRKAHVVEADEAARAFYSVN